MTKRHPGERRWGLCVEFPLMDSDGVHVLRDRRRGSDRRKAGAELDELLVLFSELPSTCAFQER